MRSAGLDGRERGLNVVERTAATGAGDVLGARHAHARRLEDHQLDLGPLRRVEVRGVEHDAVGQSVEEEHAQVGRGLHRDGLGRRVVVAAPHGHGFGVVEVQDRGAQFGRGVARDRLDHPETRRQLAPDERRLARTAAAVLHGRPALGAAHLEASRTVAEVLDQHAGHGHLALGRLGERHAHRVADAVRQQRPDAHGALDAPLQAVAGLGDAQVDRIAHPLGLHRLDEQAVGRDHHARVARLHRHDHLIEAEAPALAQELHGRDDHALRGVAPPVEDAAGQRTVVHTDAERRIVRAAEAHEALQLAVLRAVVARVDAHFVHMARGHGRRLGQEVDVGHKRRAAPLLAHATRDGPEVLRLAQVAGREAHDGASGACDAHDLRHAGLGVLRIGIGHRLHRHGAVAADRDAADAHFAGGTSSVSGQVNHKSGFFHTEDKGSDSSEKKRTFPWIIRPKSVSWR